MFRYTIYMMGHDENRRGELASSLLSHRRDKGTLWAEQVIDAAGPESRQVVYQTNGYNDLLHVYQRLDMVGALVEAYEQLANKDEERIWFR